MPNCAIHKTVRLAYNPVWETHICLECEAELDAQSRIRPYRDQDIPGTTPDEGDDDSDDEED